jgi:hypothetical protein
VADAVGITRSGCSQFGSIDRPEITVLALSGSTRRISERSPGSRRQPDGQKVRDVGVELREALVERRQSTVPGPGELGEVGVGHLPMTEYALERYVTVGNRVRPEFMALAVLHRVEHALSVGRGLPAADQQPKKASLGDRLRIKMRRCC